MSLVEEHTIIPKTEAQRIKLPRVGFLGVGWIGRNRMEAIARAGCVDIAAVADVSVETKAKAAGIVPEAIQFNTLEQLLELDLDGIVIATPSALHAEQAIAALENGIAVFCQKPLARTAPETARVIDAARANDCLLGVDLSYRYLNGMSQLRDLVRGGELGKVYAVDLVFHNAYGPDKAWFYDPQLSGGGCVIDLGIHLVDLALWCLDSARTEAVTSRLFTRGKPLKAACNNVEDYALARIDLAGDITLQLSCSWKLPAGCDAIIRASFYGTKGGVEFRNVNGSFYDFVTESFQGTSRNFLAGPPDRWGGRAAAKWAEQLYTNPAYDSEIESMVEVARTLDCIYGR